MLEVYFLEIRSHWSWHSMIIELITYLKKNYKVKFYHQKAVENPNMLYIERFNCNVGDSELVIYDEENDILKAISFCEFKQEMFEVFVKRNNPNDIFLITHLEGWFGGNIGWLKDVYKFQIKNTVYYPLFPHIDYDYYYNLRKFRGTEDLIDQMFCLFTTNRHDPHTLREMGLVSEAKPTILPINEYLSEAIKYRIGLSVHGVAEVCHRDIEYIAIGLPMLRLEYMNKLDPPLISNYHYISIPREDKFPYDGQSDRVGGEKYIEAYKKRYLEVHNDFDFLEFISNNAKAYYDEYCGAKNRLKHVLRFLNIN